MKSIYRFKILTYVLSFLGMIAAFIMLIFGVITWALNQITTELDNQLDSHYGSDVVIDQFYSAPESAEELLYFRFTRSGSNYYGSFNYETLLIDVEIALPNNAIELPGVLYFTDGGTMIVISLVVGFASLILLIVTIVAHVQGRKQLKLAAQQNTKSSTEQNLEEAKALFDKGLLTEEEYQERKQNIIDKL